MQKFLIAVFLILAAAFIGILQSESDYRNPGAAENITKVGVLLSGTRSDNNYCQSHYEALESLKDALHLELVYRENVAVDCYPEIVSLVRDEGCRIIVGVSVHFGEDMVRAAEVYPDVYFMYAGGTKTRSNLSSFFGRMYQVRYLSGVIAGMKTRTGHLGYVAAFPIPEVIRGVNAFTLGVRSVRPNAVVHVGYCRSWTEDEAAGDVCVSLLDRYPIDVMGMHTNSLAPLKEADRRGLWSVGCNYDNADLFSDTYLGACIWQWRPCYEMQIRDYLQGKVRGRNLWLDIADGVVSLSPPTRHLDERTQAAVQAANDKLWKRTFDVFYGPIRDNAGNIRIGAGESMSDEEMLNGFYWYVEGVTVEDL